MSGRVPMTKDQFVMDENGTLWHRHSGAHVHGTLCDPDEAWQEQCPEQVKARYAAFYRETIAREAERDLQRIEEIRAKVANLIATGILAQPDAGGLTFVQVQEIGTRVAKRVVPW